MSAGAPLPPRDAWRLARIRVGVNDDTGLSTDLARELAFALTHANGTGRDGALDAALKNNPDGQAIKDAIFAVDPASEEPTEHKASYVLHRASEALDEPEDLTWRVEGVLPAESLSIAAGPPGAKKTWAMLDLGACVAAGDTWLGHATIAGPVVFVDEESGLRRMKMRLGQVLRGHAADRDLPLFFTSLENFNLTTTSEAYSETNTLSGTSRLIELFEETKPALVIIDALADVMLGADENAVKDVQPILRKLRGLAEQYQTAIVLIHHANKIGGYRGSTAISGAVDLLLMVESEKDSSIVTFTSEKTRDVDAFKFSAFASFDSITDSFRLNATETQATNEHYSASEKYVIRYLTEHSQASVADIKSHADTCSASSARKAVFALALRGKLRRCDPGGNGVTAIYELVPGVR